MAFGKQYLADAKRKSVDNTPKASTQGRKTAVTRSTTNQGSSDEIYDDDDGSDGVQEILSVLESMPRRKRARTTQLSDDDESS